MRVKYDKAVIDMVNQSLTEGPKSALTLSKILGIGKTSANKAIRELFHGDEIHICGYERNGCSLAPVYAIGYAKNVAPPVGSRAFTFQKRKTMDESPGKMPDFHPRLELHALWNL